MHKVTRLLIADEPEVQAMKDQENFIRGLSWGVALGVIGWSLIVMLWLIFVR